MPMILQPELSVRAVGSFHSFRGREALTRVLFVALLAWSAQGCAGLSMKRRGEVVDLSAPAGREQTGEDGLATSEANQEYGLEGTLTVEEPVIRPAVLVFGPGQARALATLGVLRAWHEAGLPLAEIYASETSALVAALHASSRTESETEWKLLKIRSDCFVREGSMLDGLFARGQDSRCIEEAIDSAFRGLTFRDLRVPLRVGFEEAGGKVVWSNTGSIATALKNSYRSVALHGSEARVHSITDSSAFPVSGIRDSFSGPVVAVDFSSSADGAIVRAKSPSGTRGKLSTDLSGRLSQAESAYEREMREVTSRSLDSIKQADFALRPFEKKSSLRFLEHRRRQEAIATGRESLEENLPMLSTLTGVSHE